MSSKHYTRHGKIMNLMLEREFIEKANKIKAVGKFTVRKRKHLVFSVLLFYTGVRVTELARAVKEQFKQQDDLLTFDVGPREKTGHVTAPLELPLSLPFMDEVVHLLKYTRKGQKVFGFHRVTARRIIDRYFQAYPHYFRLNRITQILMDGFSLPEVMSWSGHKTIEGINPYVGQANIRNIGQSLIKKKEMGAMKR